MSLFSKEGFNIFEIFKATNMHQNFSAHFLVADGEISLDKLHPIAFQMYEFQLKNLLIVKLSLVIFKII